jgi:hypothetical protein
MGSRPPLVTQSPRAPWRRADACRVAVCEYCTRSASFCVSFGVSLGVVKLARHSVRRGSFPAMIWPWHVEGQKLRDGSEGPQTSPASSAEDELGGSGNEQCKKLQSIHSTNREQSADRELGLGVAILSHSKIRV